jgi:flagellar hook assembly protein FlgD
MFALSGGKASITLRRSPFAAMTLPRAFLVTLLVAGLGAPPAAAGVRMVARDEPLGAASKARAVQRAPLRFNMVGLHWRGSGRVWFRTRSSAGDWSPWRPARPEAEDLPDPHTREARAGRGWKLGNPYWTGSATAIDYRVAGEVTRLRAFFIWSDPNAEPSQVAARAARPDIITRAQWGADESIVRAPPYYADRVRFAVVHHTAGTNSYSASQSAAIVRGIERYHVLANGWNDIGYNFLVDRYGQVFEGRGGGIDRTVIGAHAQGFNTGSTGVAVLGTYSSARIPRAARRALVRLLAWRLDVAHVDPLAHLTWISGGNPKYPAGTAVRLRTVSGHRDTGPTTCPGNAFYGQLPTIASAVAARGLPKLYNPEVAGALGGPVRVTGRLSSALAWTVTIRDGTGALVAQGSGSGTRVDWTWDASATPFGTFSYSIEAGAGVRPWTASVPGPPPLAVRRLTVSPAVLAPSNSGALQPTTVSFRLTTAASVTVDVLDDSGTRVRRVAASRSLPAGPAKLMWNGLDSVGAVVPDGPYTVRVSAVSPGQSDSARREVVVDRTLEYLKLGPRPISPNGDGRRDVTTTRFELARPATIRVRVLHGDTRVLTLFSGALEAGAQSFDWAGTDSTGARVGDGRYRIRVKAATALGTRALSRRLRVDTKRPVVRILSAVARSRTAVTVNLSEPALLLVRFGPVTWRDGDLVTVEVSAGKSRIVHDGIWGGVRVVAWDAAENRSYAVKAKVARA